MLVLVTDEYARHFCGNGRVGVAGANGSFILDVKQADHGLLGAPVRQHLVKYDSVGTLGNLSQFIQIFNFHRTNELMNGPTGLASLCGSSKIPCPIVKAMR